MAYMKDVDYQKLINESVAKGDYTSAGTYEKARNEKIQSEGLDYKQTNYYQNQPTNTTMGTGSDKKSKSEDWTWTYKGQYADDMDQLLGKVLNREKFTYDPNTDPLYGQYRDSYTREGSRAMQDTLGEVAAQTGGLASSYAASAGAQANQNYMAKLADKIPELSQLAYSMYNDDYNRDVQNLGILQNMDNTGYGRYRDDVSDAFNNRDFNYNAGRDQIADNRYNSEIAYRDKRDQVADSRYEDETKYNRNQDTLNRAAQSDSEAFNEAMTVWQVLGYLPAKYAAILGIPAGTGTSDYSFTQAKMAQQNAKSGGSGRKSSGSKSSKKSSKASSDAKNEWSGVNQDSVLKLGLGPISMNSLKGLIEKGEVIVVGSTNGEDFVEWKSKL